MADFPNIDELIDARVVAADTETTGLSWHTDRVFGIALAWKAPEGSAWRNAWGDTPATWYGDLREPNVKLWLQDNFHRIPYWVNHHVKFDAHMLRATGIKIPDTFECTLIRETILDEDRYDYSLERISQTRLGRGKTDIWPRLADLFGGPPTKDAQIQNLSRAPCELVAEYATVDAANSLEIWEAQELEIQAQSLAVVAILERRLLRVVLSMEHLGVRVDVNRAEQSIPVLGKRVDEAQHTLDRLAGRPINVNSGVQVKQLLGVHQEADGTWYTRDGLRLEPTKSGKTGELKTEKLYQCKLPEAALIAQIRGMIKARDVFLKKYICEMNVNGYIHANINQTRSEEGDGTYTGRFSITEPALQQIHKRNKAMAALVRSCFIPDDGYEWGCYDWSQKDFRVFAHYVDDPTINARYAADPKTDFHTLVSQITGLPRDRDEKTGGANSKQMNLGLIFGMSAGRMAKEMNLAYTKNEKGFLVAGPEAEALFAKYHTNIPGANRLKASVASVARSRGYIRTQLGRRLRFPHSNEAYKAAGILFQGQAAESMKVKTVELFDALQGEDATLRLLVHDEYDLYMSKGRRPGLNADVKYLLETFDGTGEFPLKYRIPILSDAGYGEDWWQASK